MSITPERNILIIMRIWSIIGNIPPIYWPLVYINHYANNRTYFPGMCYVTNFRQTNIHRPGILDTEVDAYEKSSCRHIHCERKLKLVIWYSLLDIIQFRNVNKKRAYSRPLAVLFSYYWYFKLNRYNWTNCMKSLVSIPHMLPDNVTMNFIATLIGKLILQHNILHERPHEYSVIIQTWNDV